jgi:hypothetical protein
MENKVQLVVNLIKQTVSDSFIRLGQAHFQMLDIEPDWFRQWEL